MKKSKFILTTSLAAILGTTLVPLSANADIFHWIAKTPSEIGHLNSDGTYTVQEGDTIWAIGMHFNIKPSVIESINNISDPYTLQIGTILKLDVKDHGNKAVLSIDNGKETAEATLNNSDKIDQHKAFGKKVTNKEVSEAEKNSNFNNTPKVKVSKESSNKVTDSQSSSAVKTTQSETTASSSTAQTSSKVTQNNQATNLSNQQLGMLAYMKIYAAYQPNIVDKQRIYVTGNVIGQGTPDSTISYQINGNTLTATVDSTKKTYSYNINDLTNGITSSQEQQINSYIKAGQSNAQSYNK